MEKDLTKLARYPFLKETKEYVASLKLSPVDILNHPLYSAAVELGKQRARDAMTGRVRISTSDTLSSEISILGYVIARIIINSTANRQLIAKYASAEADSAYEFLRQEDPKTIKSIMDDLGLRPEGNKIHYTEYLKLAVYPAKQDERWKLVNRMMDSGLVSIDESENLPLLKEAIRQKIMEPMETRGAPEELKKAAVEFINTYVRKPSDIKIEKVDENAIAPCLKSMLSGLEAGLTSHNERFIIATYFIGMGLGMDGLLKVFSRFPGFNQEKTRYQLEFLTGEKGATKYSCPTCAKIKSYGLCKAECGVRHPLNYRRR